MPRHSPSLEQLSLLPAQPLLTEGSLDYAAELCGVLADAIKHCELSRHQIAARMSELTGEEISIHHLNSWTATSRDGWRFPVQYVAAFEATTNTHKVLELIARKRGCRVVIGREVLTAELGSIEAQKAELRERERSVRRLLDIHRHPSK